MKYKRLIIILPLTILVLSIFFVQFILNMRPYEMLPEIRVHDIEVISEHKIKDGTVHQGIKIQKDDRNSELFYFSSDLSGIYKFDADWDLLKSKQFSFNDIKELHFGVLGSRDANILAPVIDLSAYRKGKWNTRIVEIESTSLEVINKFNFSDFSRYIDAFDFHENEFWVSYKDFVSVYRLIDNELSFSHRYKIYTGTSQGLRINENRLCMVGENKLMRARSLRDGIYCYELKSLKRFKETFTSVLFSRIESFISSLNYRFPNQILSRYYPSNLNIPQNMWAYGFPIERPDNEGFDFSSENGVIWISRGHIARKIKLIDY
jgi:hypothetical protein